jgi:hypothetical protein
MVSGMVAKKKPKPNSGEAWVMQGKTAEERAVINKKKGTRRNTTRRHQKRTTKLTAVLRQKFYEKFRDGATHKIAYQACGISENTYYTWWKKGDPDSDDAREPFVEFRQECERLMAEVKLDAIKKVLHAHEEGGVGKLWPSWMTYLERTEPSDFTKKQSLGPSEQPIAIQINLGTEDSRKAIRQGVVQPKTQRMTLELPADAGSSQP